MNFVIVFSKTALEDIEKHKKSGDKVLLKKIEKLLNELRIHPTTGTGQPEALKYDCEGLYSRRINQKHRLVYSIQQEIVTVLVLSEFAHYGDK